MCIFMSPINSNPNLEHIVLGLLFINTFLSVCLASNFDFTGSFWSYWVHCLCIFLGSNAARWHQQWLSCDFDAVAPDVPTVVMVFHKLFPFFFIEWLLKTRFTLVVDYVSGKSVMMYQRLLARLESCPCRTMLDWQTEKEQWYRRNGLQGTGVR